MPTWPTKKTTKRITYREDAVQKNIVAYLRKSRFMVTSQCAGLIKSVVTQKIAKSLGYLKGSPDLIVWAKNCTLNIEVKKPALMTYSFKSKKMIIADRAGEQSDEQKEFEQMIKTIPGHHYIVAKSVDEVSEYIKTNNIEPR